MVLLRIAVAKSLSKDIIAGLEQRKFSEAELNKIWQKIRQMPKKNAWVDFACDACVALIVLGICVAGAWESLGEFPVTVAVVLGAAYIGLLLVLYWAFFHKAKSQFLKRVRKFYPELTERFTKK